MPSFAQWQDIESIAKAAREAKPRLIHVVREIWRHDRSTDGRLCPCKCGSRDAVRVETRPHLEVLIDRVSGLRRVRRPHNAEAFDRVAAKAERIAMPFRCYDEQIDPVLDRKHKVIGVFGGVRAGKSETGKEKAIDHWLEYGGRGVCIWWVAPTREMTQIGVNKLFRGERTNRFVRPAFPASLVRSYPTSELAACQDAVLIDGSRVCMKYGANKGRNLKGRVPILVVLDEGAECPHEIVWTILVTRTMESGGQVIACTTPVAGHWLKTLADQGVPYHALTPDLEADDVQRVTVTLSCLRNPWVSVRRVEQTIKALGGKDDPRVKREVFGLWVAEGNILWRHWNAKIHMIEGVGDVPADFGFVNVTRIATRHFLPRGARNDVIAGWDCNDYPQSLVLAYVVVREGEDQGDPTKWQLLVTTEIVRSASIIEWGKFLALKAAKLRGKPDDWIAKLSIVADANTTYSDTRVQQIGKGADADVLRGHGFVVVPPAWTQAAPDKPAKPENPRIRLRVRILHQLMHENRIRLHGDCRKLLEAIEGQVCDERGLPLKVAGNASDRLSGPADALGYLAYRIWHEARPGNEERGIRWQ
jgi:hypothetical protein